MKNSGTRISSPKTIAIINTAIGDINPSMTNLEVYSSLAFQTWSTFDSEFSLARLNMIFLKESGSDWYNSSKIWGLSRTS